VLSFAALSDNLSQHHQFTLIFYLAEETKVDMLAANAFCIERMSHFLLENAAM
jgi:hypothetical protein